MPILLPFIISLVKEFDENRCYSLWRNEEIDVEIKHKQLVESCASTLGCESEVTINKNSILISKTMSAIIRPKIAHYLNTLEILATAWRHHAVDRDIIEEEFVFIFSKHKNNFPFEVFRKITGVYPSIDEIIKTFDQINDRRVNKKPIA